LAAVPPGFVVGAVEREREIAASRAASCIAVSSTLSVKSSVARRSTLSNKL
jgi:hypothetical protein